MRIREIRSLAGTRHIRQSCAQLYEADDPSYRPSEDAEGMHYLSRRASTLRTVPNSSAGWDGLHRTSGSCWPLSPPAC